METATGILIVEDRSIVASKIKRELERAGFTVAGMAATREAGSQLAATLALEAAILDVDLRGEPAYPVAEVLRRRAIPFLFLTGYSHIAIPPVWQDVLLVEKPFEGSALVRALQAAMNRERAAPGEVWVTTPAIRQAWDQVRHTRDILTEQRAWAEQYGFSRPPR